MFFTRLLIVLGLWSAAMATTTSRTIAENTITFTFNCAGQDCKCGRFITGEYWAAPITVSGTRVATVTITAIDPAGTANAAESNPSSGTQFGVLTGWKGYTAAKNIMTKLPYAAKAGESIMKMIAKQPSTACPCVASQTNGCVAVWDVLTILDTVPPDNGATIFRPPYAGTAKPLRSITNVHLERLPHIQAISNNALRSSFASIIARWNSPGYELTHDPSLGEMMRAATPLDKLGTDYAADVAKVYLHDVLSVFGTETGTQKDSAIYMLMQQGFDNYAIYQMGIPFSSGAGQHLGKKPTIVFAAALYEDPVMLEEIRAAVSRPWTTAAWFQEDRQISTTAFSTTPVWGEGGGYDRYANEHWYWWRVLNVSKGGIDNQRTDGDPYGFIDGPAGGPLSISYQWCCSTGPFVSFALAMHLMPWMMYANNDREIIDYSDRVWNGRGISGFSGGWWGAPDPCAKPDTLESSTCVPVTGAGCLYYKKTWGPDPNKPGDCIRHNGDPMTDGRYSSLHGMVFPPPEWGRLSFITLSMWNTYRKCADPADPTYPCAGLGLEVPTGISHPGSAQTPGIIPTITVYPNPVRQAAVIHVPGPQARIMIFDGRGQMVRQLMNGGLWDGRNDAGRRLPQGVYVVKTGSSPITETCAVLLLK
jgi:hypothetical protein